MPKKSLVCSRARRRERDRKGAARNAAAPRESDSYLFAKGSARHTHRHGSRRRRDNLTTEALEYGHLRVGQMNVARQAGSGRAIKDARPPDGELAPGARVADRDAANRRDCIRGERSRLEQQQGEVTAGDAVDTSVAHRVLEQRRRVHDHQRAVFSDEVLGARTDHDRVGVVGVDAVGKRARRKPSLAASAGDEQRHRRRVRSVTARVGGEELDDRLLEHVRVGRRRHELQVDRREGTARLVIGAHAFAKGRAEAAPHPLIAPHERNAAVDGELAGADEGVGETRKLSLKRVDPVRANVGLVAQIHVFRGLGAGDHGVARRADGLLVADENAGRLKEDGVVDELLGTETNAAEIVEVNPAGFAPADHDVQPQRGHAAANEIALAVERLDTARRVALVELHHASAVTEIVVRLIEAQHEPALE